MEHDIRRREAARVRFPVAHPERLDDATLEIAAATARVNARRWRRFATWVTDGGQVRPDIGRHAVAPAKSKLGRDVSDRSRHRGDEHAV